MSITRESFQIALCRQWLIGDLAWPVSTGASSAGLTNQTLVDTAVVTQTFLAGAKIIHNLAGVTS